MFENLLYQSAADFLADDIANGNLPQALLLAGPAMSGKLTAACARSFMQRGTEGCLAMFVLLVHKT